MIFLARDQISYVMGRGLTWDAEARMWLGPEGTTFLRCLPPLLVTLTGIQLRIGEVCQITIEEIAGSRRAAGKRNEE